MRELLFVFILFFSFTSFAQNNCVLTFHHTINNKEIVLDQQYKIGEDTIQIQTLKYYISSIQFLQKGKVVWKEKNSFHLINEEEPNTKKLVLKNMPNQIQFDAIKLNIGIDSATNYDGVKGADLDPTKGMYWTWQNGYINLKLEGNSPKCNTRNNKFQFHIGGYTYPFATLQTIKLFCKSSKEINIQVDIDKLINQIDLSSQNEIMQPCIEAVDFAQKFNTIFTIK